MKDWQIRINNNNTLRNEIAKITANHDVTVTYNGAPLTEGTDYAYDASIGLFTTAASRIAVPAATYTQDATTGAYTVTPGTAILTVTGTV